MGKNLPLSKRRKKKKKKKAELLSAEDILETPPAAEVQDSGSLNSPRSRGLSRDTRLCLLQA